MSSRCSTTSPPTLRTPRRALVAPRQARHRALAAQPHLQPHWGLLAELSSLDHAGDSSPSSHRSSSGSSPSSRRSTTSRVMLGTPRRALVARPHLRQHWGLLVELLSLLVRLVAELSQLDHVSGHAGDSSLSSHRSSSGLSLSSRSSTTSPATLGTPRRALVARPCLRPRWGLIAELSSLLVRLVAELSPLDHVFGHARDSSSSSRRSTMSPATLGTSRRALVAPRQAHRRALIARSRL
jgi:hypothetical protein